MNSRDLLSRYEGVNIMISHKECVSLLGLLYRETGASGWSDGLVRFWLCDNGPGIASEVQSRLFTSCNEIGRLNTPKHDPGLPIVQRVVEKLRAQVGAASEAGMGSLFFFTPPAVPPSHEQELAASYSNLEPERSDSMRVAQLLIARESLFSGH
jgi:hypothetical protein